MLSPAPKTSANVPSEDLERAVPFRGGGFEIGGSGRAVMSWIAVALIIGVWQFSSDLGFVRQSLLPSPLAVLREIFSLALDGQLWSDLGASLVRFIIGWTAGCLIGLAAGISMGLSPPLRALGEPLTAALFSVPKIALLPLIILWLGIGELSKDVTIAASVFFPMVISTYSSLDSVPRNLIRMAQSFGLSTRAIIWKVLLPGAVPGLIAGIRISASMGLLTVIVAEMVGAQHGIGAFTLLAGTLLRSDQVIAGVVIIAFVGALIGAAISIVEKYLLRWR